MKSKYLYQDSKHTRMLFEIAKHLNANYNGRYSVSETEIYSLLNRRWLKAFVVYKGKYLRGNSRHLAEILIEPDYNEQGYSYYKFPYLNKEDKRHIVGEDYSDVLNYIDEKLANI